MLPVESHVTASPLDNDKFSNEVCYNLCLGIFREEAVRENNQGVGL